MTTEKGAKHPSWLMALGNAAPARAPCRLSPFTLGHLVKSAHIWLGPFLFGQVRSHLVRSVHIWLGPFTFGQVRSLLVRSVHIWSGPFTFG